MYPSYLDTRAPRPLTIRTSDRYPGYDLTSGRHTRRGPRAARRFRRA
jgi:hypothetical protein